MLNDNQEIKRHLENVLDAPSQFGIGDAISNGFDIWKKNVGGFIGFILLVGVISFFLGLIPLIGPILNYVWIGPALTLGGLLICHEIVENNNSDFNIFFSGFKFSGDIVIAHLLISILYLLIFGGAAFSIFGGFNFFEMDPMELSALEVPWWIWLVFVVAIYLTVIFAFVTLFIGVYRLSGIEAIQYSIKFAHKNLLSLIIFFIIAGILSMLGLIAIIIGVIVTATFWYPFLYSAFRQITSYELLSDNDNIIEDILVEE